jgi:hypothetical protein
MAKKKLKQRSNLEIIREAVDAILPLLEEIEALNVKIADLEAQVKALESA